MYVNGPDLLFMATPYVSNILSLPPEIASAQADVLRENGR